MHTRANNHLKIKGLQHRRVRHNLKKADPAIDSVSVLNESTDEYVLYVAVPGMQRKDFAISIKGKRLIVSAGKKENLHIFHGQKEPSPVHWAETFKLPEDADTVMTAAVYRHGELAIHIPKGESAPTKENVDVFVY